MRKSKSFQLLSGVTGDDLFTVAPAVNEKPVGKEALDNIAMPTMMLGNGGDEPTLHDVLALLECEAPLPVDEATAILSPTTVSEVGSVTSPDRLEGDAGSHFFEGFTNLDEFLFTESIYNNLQQAVAVEETPMEVEPIIDLRTVGEATITTTTTNTDVVGKRRRTTKRTAKQAFGDDVAATTSTPTTITAPNPDHNDYVTKKPCKSAVVSSTGVTTTTTAVPAENRQMTKEQKYRERRIKNNIASKRSRETRKQKFSTMEQKAVELEAANKQLELQVVELEQLTKKMKDILVKRLAQST